jgi:hypothetical protein
MALEVAGRDVRHAVRRPEDELGDLGDAFLALQVDGALDLQEVPFGPVVRLSQRLDQGASGKLAPGHACQVDLQVLPAPQLTTGAGRISGRRRDHYGGFVRHFDTSNAS